MELRQKILFIINPHSGNHSVNWAEEIEVFFASSNHHIELYFLDDGCKTEDIKKKIAGFHPDKVVAVGGDGTVALVAECVLQKNIPFAILPAGSANGLAKELGISEIPAEALKVISEGELKKIHVIIINGQLCIHLSDVGYNARMIKKFQMDNKRGFWGYLTASLTVIKNILFVNPTLVATMTIDGKPVKVKASMIVFANATKYGSGALINPTGNMEDELFEVIVIKKLSVLEIFKMVVTHTSYDRNKTEVFEAKNLKINLSKKMHFQVDGEYLGKTNTVEAHIIPAALEIIVPVMVI